MTGETRARRSAGRPASQADTERERERGRGRCRPERKKARAKRARYEERERAQSGRKKERKKERAARRGMAKWRHEWRRHEESSGCVQYVSTEPMWYVQVCLQILLSRPPRVRRETCELVRDL